MRRPLSQLFYSRIQDGDGSPTIITLHKHYQRGRDVAAYAQAAGPTARILSLESYKGIFVGREIVGYTWFLGPLDTPPPVFFGDALGEIERFLWDEVDRQESPDVQLPFLLGVEQGAIMALAAAAAIPDLVSGVIAIEPTLPEVPGWTPPLAPLENLPVLLVDYPKAPAPKTNVLTGTALADRLESWGAVVARVEAEPEPIPGETLSSWLASQPVRYRTT